MAIFVAITSPVTERIENLKGVLILKRKAVLTMTDKIKRFIQKIKTRFKQEQCYNRMESKGIATMSMCCGIQYNDMRLPTYQKLCITCPYFRNIRGTNNER